jgi:hypothetical protein
MSAQVALGHPCLISSYKFKPVPSDPVRTSILVRITIQTLAIQLRLDVRLGIHLDIHVSLRLTSLSPCLRGPLGPLSVSVLRVPRGSEPLVTASTGATSKASSPQQLTEFIISLNSVSIYTSEHL